MIVVTGANGHLGRRLLRELTRRRLLRAVVRSEHTAAQISTMGLYPEPELGVADYLDAAAMSAALEGARHVIHLVGIIKQSSTSSYALAHEHTARVLAAAAHAAAIDRIIYLGIIGSRPDSPDSCLASKGNTQEMLLRAETRVLVLRVPMVLGEADRASHALARQAEKRWNVMLRAQGLGIGPVRLTFRDLTILRCHSVVPSRSGKPRASHPRCSSQATWRQGSHCIFLVKIAIVLPRFWVTSKCEYGSRRQGGLLHPFFQLLIPGALDHHRLANVPCVQEVACNVLSCGRGSRS